MRESNGNALINDVVDEKRGSTPHRSPDETTKTDLANVSTDISPDKPVVAV